ncbi:MAG: hypothetical protein K8J31_00640 [Anaerolineae bacterium]|nr:hypothetical protein [Anaerolineae bacterium]
MAATDTQSNLTPARTRRKPGWPLAGQRFDLLATALAAWVILGVFIDVNAHNHGRVDDTFFTPWHFLLYSGVLANGIFLGIAQYRHVGQGYAWLRALPKGYLPSLIGVVLFGGGGGFDFVWHSLFGFEVNLEALLSPAHLWLATGAVLFLIGPLRATWGRAQAAGWRDLFPAIVSATITLSLLTMFTEFAHVMSQPDVFATRSPGGNRYFWDVTQAASVLIPAVLMSATLLLLLRRWRLPFGAVTFVLTVNALLMFYLRLGYIGEYWLVLLAAPLAGLVGDVAILRLRPSLARPGALRLVAFAVPFVYFLAYFAILLTTARIGWTIHLWLGVTVMAGITGLGLSYLVAPPALPEDAQSTE